MSRTVDNRREAFRTVAKEYGVEAHRDYSGAEDYRDDLAAAYMPRWVAVTSGEVDGTIYVIPCGTEAEATERAHEYAEDPTYAEQPLAVVDLDIGLHECAQLARVA
jgi:hypothetical protein